MFPRLTSVARLPCAPLPQVSCACRIAVRVLIALAGWLAIGGVPTVMAQGYFEKPLLPPTCAADDERSKVLLIGSYHMGNPGADQFNLEADDVLSDRRQREVAALIDRLATFAPSAVAVEAPWGDSATVARWEGYVRGERELRRSEEEQIGFRLAHRLGHDRIYGIDSRIPLDFEGVGQAAAADPRLAPLLGQMNAVGNEAIETLARWLGESTVGGMLARMNTPEMILRSHVPYVEFFVPIVTDDSYAGPDMVGDWYKRNLRIFANLTRISGPAADRIVVVFGAGHIALLRQFVIEHPAYCIEDPLDYLNGL